MKIDISEEIKGKYEDIILSMKKKINMKSNYSRKINHNNNDGNQDFNTYAGNSSSLEMMAQLRIFSSKSKVDILSYNKMNNFFEFFIRS